MTAALPPQRPTAPHAGDPAAHTEAVAGSVAVPAEAATGFRLAIAGVLIVGILAGLFVFGYLSRRRDTKNLAAAAEASIAQPPSVDVVAVRRATADAVLTLPGNARPFYETTLYARTSGYVKAWNHDIGDRVKAGELLATLETPELDDQLTAAQAKGAEQQSEVDLAQSSVNFAKLSYERWQSAVPEGVVSTQDRDQKRAELDNANAKLEAAKAQLKLADAQVKGLQTLVNFKNVTAPFAGTITKRDIDIGDLVTAGSTSSTTPLFSIANSDQVRVFVDVPQSAASQIVDGMEATVQIANAHDQPFRGHVSRTADSMDIESRTLRVEVLVPNPDHALKPGMYVQATFVVHRKTPPLEIPASALAMRPSGPQAAVISADGTVTFKAIHIAEDLGDRIDVDSGLDDGDKVALNVSSDLNNGDKVTVLAENAK